LLAWTLALNRLTVSATDLALANGMVWALQQWLSHQNKPNVSQSPLKNGLTIVPAGGLIKVQWGQAVKPTAVGWTQPHWQIIGNTRRLSLLSVFLVKHPLIDAELTPTQQANRLKATLLHEAGHVLGLDHTHQSEAVMHPQGWKNAVLTPWEAALFYQKYARLTEPNYIK